VAPFVVALAPLALCGVLVVRTWEENYGNRKQSSSSLNLLALKQNTN
jgi:hypothetical protein